MPTESPKVDILMATYNGEKYIHEQIASLQCQTYTNWNLLVCDDGSTDGTLSIIGKLQKIDDRIKIVARDAGFHSSAGNFLSLLKQSEAPYVMFCDQDDVWLEDKVEKSLDAMQEAEKSNAGFPVLVFTDSVVVDSSLGLLKPSFTAPMRYDPEKVSLMQSLFINVAQGSSMLMNRALVDVARHLEKPEVFGQHDYWIAVIARAIGVVVYSCVPTLLYRQHEENVIGATRPRKLGVFGRVTSIKNVLCSNGWKRVRGDLVKDGVVSPGLRAQFLLNEGLFLTEETKSQLEEIVAMKTGSVCSRLVALRKYKILEGSTCYEKANELFRILIC